MKLKINIVTEFEDEISFESGELDGEKTDGVLLTLKGLKVDTSIFLSSEDFEDFVKVVNTFNKSKESLDIKFD